MTITPTKTDIKSGGGNHNHPGNKVYNSLVSTKRKAFVLAYKDEKAKNAIVQSIYDAIRKQSPPGRFLKKNKDGSYSINSKEDALKKIKKSLNENKAKIEEYFRLRGQFPPPVKASTKLTTKATSRLEKGRKKEKITSSDWHKLSAAINNLDQDEIRQIKRQKLRGIQLTEKINNKGKKSSKKESKHSVDSLSGAMKSLSLYGKGKISKKRV